MKIPYPKMELIMTIQPSDLPFLNKLLTKKMKTWSTVIATNGKTLTLPGTHSPASKHSSLQMLITSIVICDKKI